jgi:hypothetical protein
MLEGEAMKMPLGWHKGCLKNSLRYQEEQAEVLKQQIHRFRESRSKNRLHAAQIARAEAEGRDGFDDEKFFPKGYTKP